MQSVISRKGEIHPRHYMLVELDVYKRQIVYFVFKMFVTVISKQNKLRWLPRNGIWNGNVMNAS